MNVAHVCPCDSQHPIKHLSLSKYFPEIPKIKGSKKCDIFSDCYPGICFSYYKNNDLHPLKISYHFCTSPNVLQRKISQALHFQL